MKLIVTLGLCLFLSSQDAAKHTVRPVDVFAKLDGEWRGTFVGYDPAGAELYRIAVTQQYRTIDANTQVVVVRDRMADGKVITGKGKNIAHRNKDGSLRLHCTVTKSNGERVEHRGRVIRGPDGKRELVWYSNTSERTETFREWVTGRGKGAVYHIQGMGRYGKTMMLMAGAYRRPRGK